MDDAMRRAHEWKAAQTWPTTRVQWLLHGVGCHVARALVCRYRGHHWTDSFAGIEGCVRCAKTRFTPVYDRSPYR